MCFVYQSTRGVLGWFLGFWAAWVQCDTESSSASGWHFRVSGGHGWGLAAPEFVTASFSVSQSGLDLLPSLLCPVWQFHCPNSDKNAEFWSYLLAGNSFLLSPFPSTADLWLVSPAIYFLSPTITGRTSRWKWGQLLCSAIICLKIHFNTLKKKEKVALDIFLWSVFVLGKPPTISKSMFSLWQRVLS